MKTLSLVLLAAAILPACKWTDFDDLEADTWVHSTTKPNSDSADYGVAIIRGGKATDPAGDRLVVLGAGQALYSELNFSPAGTADFVSTTEVKLNNQFAISTLDPQPLLVADPTGDEVTLVVNSGGGSIAILSGQHTLSQRQIFNPKNASPDAAAYVNIGGHSSLIVAAIDTVYGSPTVNPPTSQASCALTEADGTTAVQVRAMAGVKVAAGDTDDSILVWTDKGKLLVYPSGVFSADAIACPAGVATPLLASTPVDTGFMPFKGSRLHVLDNRYVIVAGHDENIVNSKVAMYDMQANGATVGAPLMTGGMRSSTILTVDSTHRFFVAGYPNQSVDGTATGEVVVYTISTSSGIDVNTPVERLSDAQPDTNELFGRDVAAFSFNGHQILVVAADNEVFAYFHTTMYDETRTK